MFSQGVSLTQLAAHVSLSSYYLLRAFRAEVGMPPHAYLDSVRIRHAQKLIEAGKPLSEVAAEVGFSSQSHLTHGKGAPANGTISYHYAQKEYGDEYHRYLFHRYDPSFDPLDLSRST